MERALRGAGAGEGLRHGNARCEARSHTTLWRPWVFLPSISALGTPVDRLWLWRLGFEFFPAILDLLLNSLLNLE